MKSLSDRRGKQNARLIYYFNTSELLARNGYFGFFGAWHPWCFTVDLDTNHLGENIFRPFHYFSAALRYSASALFLSLSRMPRPNRSSISTRMTSL
jgi:hypothetical protein